LSLIETYLTLGLPNVEGWLELYSAEWIAVLSHVQRNASISGAVAEIGVHHGKLFILLLLGKYRSEGSLVIDIFDKQHLNIDGSGRGDQTIFLDNIKRWRGDTDDVTIFARSSLDVSAQDIIGAVGTLRLLSIDGGHTEECAFNDICLAERVLHDHGVAILDDVFHPDWPGVISGLARYIYQSSILRPFAITPNKVYLARSHNCEFYQSEMCKRFKSRRSTTMFGVPVECYGDGSFVGFARNKARENLIGRYLWMIKRRLHGQVLVDP